MSEVTFREDDHSYRVDHRRIPGVTELLKPVSQYYGNGSTAARELGSTVHEACALDDLNDLDEESVPEEAYGYLTAWRAFKREWLRRPPIPEWAVEFTVHNRTMNYAGTVDRYGLVDGDEHWSVIDLKTGLKAPWYGLQLYAYAAAMADMGIALRPPYGWVVYLKQDGSVDSERIDLDPTLHHTNLVALRRVWDLKKEYGLA